MANNTHYELSAPYRRHEKSCFFFGNIELLEWFWQLGSWRRNICVDKTKYTAESAILKLGSVGSRRVAGRIFSSNVHFSILSLWLSSIRVSLWNRNYIRALCQRVYPSNPIHYIFSSSSSPGYCTCSKLWVMQCQLWDCVCGWNLLLPFQTRPQSDTVIKSTCSRLPRVDQSSVFWTNSYQNSSSFEKHLKPTNTTRGKYFSRAFIFVTTNVLF